MAIFHNLTSRAKLRSVDGCWTCRVRRKKCSETRPVCDECRALRITCHFQKEKPDWADGGVKQKAMMDKIKADVKAQAHAGRRPWQERAAAPRGLDGPPLAAGADELDHSTPSSGTRTTGSDAGIAGYRAGTESTSDAEGGSHWISPTDAAWPGTGRTRVAHPTRAQDKELHLLMMYVDYIFPYLFPHYRPPMLAGGRRWIVHVLESNKSVNHSAMSLAGYFCAVAITNGDKVHEECTTVMAGEVGQQVCLGLQELQKDLEIVNARNRQAGTEERLVVMQGILQMLCFDVATSISGNWKLHLDAALDVFAQLLPNPREWVALIDDLYSPNWPTEEGVPRPWAANQAAVRFFTAMVIYMDVMSCVTLGIAPRLAHYHESVIPRDQSYDRRLEPLSPGPLFLEEFFGLPNWVVRTIGDVAALESWKQAQKLSSSLSVTELASRGLALSERIKRGIESLEHQSTEKQSASLFLFLDPDSMHGNYQRQQVDYQHIWLLATLSYLHVVVSGWQTSNREIRECVSKAAELLSQIPAGSCVKTLAWPLCVCACMCAPEEEDGFRQLLRSMSDLHMFGSIQKVVMVVENVWSRRSEVDDNWTVGKCLNILGFGVLLA